MNHENRIIQLIFSFVSIDAVFAATNSTSVEAQSSDDWSAIGVFVYIIFAGLGIGFISCCYQNRSRFYDLFIKGENKNEVLRIYKEGKRMPEMKKVRRRRQESELAEVEDVTRKRQPSTKDPSQEEPEQKKPNQTYRPSRKPR